MDSLIERNLRFQKGEGGFEPEDGHFLVFVDSLTKIYTGPSEVGQTVAITASSPFLGKGIDECSQMLQDVVRAGSHIDHEHFIIFDGRSLEDNTVLVVEKEIQTEGNKAAISVRMADKIVSFENSLYVAGDSSVREDYQ